MDRMRADSWNLQEPVKGVLPSVAINSRSSGELVDDPCVGETWTRTYESSSVSVRVMRRRRGDDEVAAIAVHGRFDGQFQPGSDSLWYESSQAQMDREEMMSLYIWGEYSKATVEVPCREAALRGLQLYLACFGSHCSPEPEGEENAKKSRSVVGRRRVGKDE
jgi:hypothetical protein